MAKYKRFVKPLGSLPLYLSAAVYAVDTDTLWLPASHTTYYLKLKEAAETAEALERCQTVLRGTIDLDQSEDDHPIFRILCRQANHKTYNEMVDGLTMETLTTKVVVEEKLNEEELEQIRLEEEKRRQEALELKKLNVWNTCSAQLQDKISLMDSVTWVGDYPPEPERFDEQQATFYVDFDAKNMHGKALHYRAQCKVTLPDEVKLQIRKRSLIPVDQNEE